MDSDRPFILTLELEPALTQTLDALRKRYFPPERSVLAAHVTLFHALPSDQETALRRDLETVCRETPPFGVALPELNHWGKGIFVTLESPELLSIRKKLAERWQGRLTLQDRQRYRPHVTIQNKVPKDEAKALYHTLAPIWQPLKGGALGVTLWRYAGGPWAFAAAFGFTGQASSQATGP